MAPPFTFLDRIDALVGGPAAVAAAVRRLVLPGGDRPVTRAGSAGRIPDSHVRRHVAEVALDVVAERVREGLVGALQEHFTAVREEFEMLEGEEPPEPDDSSAAMSASNEWWEMFACRIVESFDGTDLGEALGYPFGVSQACGNSPTAERLADAVLAGPVADPDAVLARAGLDAAALDAIVAEIREPACGPQQLDYAGERMPVGETRDPQHAENAVDDAAYAGWTVEWLGVYLSRARLDPALVEEGVAYVLTDPDMIATGAELLGLAGDAAFRAWAEERAVLSTPERDATDVAMVLRLVGPDENTEGGGQPDIGLPGTSNATPETAAGASEGAAPAAQQGWPKGFVTPSLVRTPFEQQEYDAQVAEMLDDVDTQELARRSDEAGSRAATRPTELRTVVSAAQCGICGRVLKDPGACAADDPAMDCGGHCKSCVDAAENSASVGATQPAKPRPPVAVEPSDLTHAVSAALAALFDHGCETDKAMAAALGVDRSVVAGARKGTAPWAPDGPTCSKISAVLRRHAVPIGEALQDMEVFGA